MVLSVLDMAGYQIISRMLTTSTMSCAKLCSYGVKQSKMNGSVNLLVSKANFSSSVGRLSAFPKTYFCHKKNFCRSYSLLEINKRYSERFFSVDTSSDRVQEMTDQCTANEYIKGLVDELFERSIERDKMIAVVPKSDLQKHITCLVEAGFQKVDILNLYRYPELIKNMAPFTDVITLLLEYGIQKEEISNIVNNCPNVVYKTKTEIMSKIEKFYALGFTSDSIVKMICNYPALLDKDLSYVPQRIEDLKNLFKTKDTFRFLEGSPDLLFCDYNHILQRFNYVYTVMGITQPQMRHSKLFSYPLEHIHARHMFVERAGFFKKFARKKGQIDTNPSLDIIIDTSDEEFVKRFGNMSVKDYLTFKKLLLKDRVISTDLEEYFED